MFVNIVLTEMRVTVQIRSARNISVALTSASEDLKHILIS